MEFIYEKSRIFMKDADGTVIAEITFPITDGVATIDHTFVDGSLRGQGVAGKLVTATANAIRACGLKAMPTCSYAAKWFADRPEQQDILI